MEMQNAAVLDPAVIITRVTTIREARALPLGALVGDRHGGLTFTDAIAAELEIRSTSGWQEMRGPAGEVWTIIAVTR